MPRTNNPSPRLSGVGFNEASPLRSPRDSEAVGRSWIKHRAANANLDATARVLAALTQQVNRLRRRAGGGDAAAGMVYLGEWDEDAVYSPQNVVTRAGLGEFVCLQSPPAGTQPETGAPYWHGFAYPSPGTWG